MSTRGIENGRISSARPKSSKGRTKVKNGIKPSNVEAQTKFAMDAQALSPEVKALMKKYPSMSEISVDLFECIRNRNIAKLKKLMKSKDCDKNERDVDDESFPTPLIVATEMEDTEMVKMLINAKHNPAKVNVENLYCKRPVWIAARNRCTGILDFLINGNEDCEVNFIDKQSGTTPLYEAVIGNSVEAARLLIQARADVNMRRLGPQNGPDTPLTKAIQMNNKEMVELLLNSLAKMQTKAEGGLTALHYAVAYRRYDICEILLENGAKLHAKTKSGVTAMAIAIENHNPAMTRMLLDYGYKMDKKFKWRETPLQQAIFVHAEDCAMTLIHYGCSLRKDKGPSYFRLAANGKLIKIVKFLIALKPTFLNEAWVQREDWPVSIYHRPDIYEWLKRESRKVRSLMFHCRYQIFGYLGRHPKNKISELPIPDKLKDYLHYNEFVKEKYYVKKALDVRECPFDCPSICSVPHCPPIEVSTESDDDSSEDLNSDDETKPIDTVIEDKSDQTKSKCDKCETDVHNITNDDSESKHRQPNNGRKRLRSTKKTMSSKQIVLTQTNVSNSE